MSASTGHRVIAVAIGVLTWVVVVAIGTCAAVVVGQSMLHPGTGPVSMSGPAMPETIVWYGFVPICIVTALAVGLGVGVGAARLSIWLSA